MSTPDTTPADHAAARIVAFGAGAAIAGGLMVVVGHLFNEFVHGVSPLLNANNEGTVWTWMSVAATAGVAFGAVLGGLFSTRHRNAYWLLAAVCAFLSMDDLTSIHERISARFLQLTGLPGTLDSVVWPVMYLPLVLIVAVVVLRLGREGSRATERTVLAGLGLLVLAVVGEVLSAPWTDPTDADNVVHSIEGAFEEGAEQAGWTLLAAVVFARALHEKLAQMASGDGGHPLDVAVERISTRRFGRDRSSVSSATGVGTPAGVPPLLPDVPEEPGPGSRVSGRERPAGAGE